MVVRLQAWHWPLLHGTPVQLVKTFQVHWRRSLHRVARASVRRTGKALAAALVGAESHTKVHAVGAAQCPAESHVSIMPAEPARSVGCPVANLRRTSRRRCKRSGMA